MYKTIFTSLFFLGRSVSQCSLYISCDCTYNTADLEYLDPNSLNVFLLIIEWTFYRNILWHPNSTFPDKTNSVCFSLFVSFL